MKNGRWKILVLLLVLLFPVLFWLLLTRGHNEFKHLPFYGPYTLSAGGDTIHHAVRPFQLTNQQGNLITSNDLSGKIVVANFFFSTCKTVCPEMNEKVRRVQEAFKGFDGLKILSFTVDPENDTPAQLAEYADQMQANDSMWWFLTGNKDSIYSLARESFLVPAAEGEAANDFFHSQDIILLDPQRRMRGIYDGNSSAEIDTLIDEIKVLLRETNELSGK